MGALTKEEYEQRVKENSKIQKEIRQFTPIAKGEIENMSIDSFIDKVCYGKIDERINAAKEGDFLFECFFHNRKYFDAKNRLEHEKIFKHREKPTIDVNVAGLAKFTIKCPYYEEFLCKLKGFIFEPREKEIQKL